MNTPRRRAGFSLIELMVVVAIMAALMIIIVPAISGLMTSGNLTRGGQLLTDQIGLARQLASARNTSVEVRLIKFTRQDAYDAVQLWNLDTTGTARALSRVATLPAGTVISADKTLSKILNNTRTDLTMSIQGTNCPYTFFQIRPNGIVLPLTDMANSYVTIVSQKPNATLENPLKNFVTIQINPSTGTPLVYRP